MQTLHCHRTDHWIKLESYKPDSGLSVEVTVVITSIFK